MGLPYNQAGEKAVMLNHVILQLCKELKQDTPGIVKKSLGILALRADTPNHETAYKHLSISLSNHVLRQLRKLPPTISPEDINAVLVLINSDAAHTALLNAAETVFPGEVFAEQTPTDLLNSTIKP